MTTHEGSAEVRTPGGWKARLDGLDMQTILILVIMGLIGFGIWQHQIQEFRSAAAREENNKASFMEQHKVTQNLLRMMTENQGVIIKGIAEGQARNERAAYMMTYVLTLNERERKELKLAMPNEFRTGYAQPK